MADYYTPTRAELVAALRSKTDPGGCTQGPINGARVDCRTFHVNRVQRWCRTCLLLEAADRLSTPGERTDG